MKPQAPHRGFVDGAWWPHGDDIATELPALLAALSMRLGPVDRVVYKVGDWATAPAELVIDGHRAHLEGHRLQPPNTVEVHGPNRTRILLLIVPPHTDPDCAHTAMMTAADPDDESTVDGLLMIGLRERESRTQRAAAQANWEHDTGALRRLGGRDD